MVFGSAMMLKGLLLPKLNVHMPNIMFNVKGLLLITHATATRVAEQVAGHASNYTKVASAYAIILFAASSLRLSGELRLLARLVMQVCNVILGLHGIELNVGSEATSSMQAAGYVEDAEETEDDASLSPTHGASEDEEPEAEATDAETSNESDDNTSYKDFTTFWETRPTRDMSKQLSLHEIEVHKTDLNAATLEVWKLKTLT
jgi:hypothetical protein